MIETGGDGVVRVVGRGTVLTGDLFGAVELAWLLRLRRGADDYLAVIFDLRETHLPDLGRMSREEVPFPGIMSVARALPLAFVVPADSLAAARAYCMDCAMRGAISGAFASMDEALDWVLQRAQALQAQGRAQGQRRTIELVTRRHTRGGAGLGH